MEFDTFSKLVRAATLQPLEKRETLSLLYDAGYDMLDMAEQYSLNGDIWFTYYALKIAGDDNPLGRACEMGGTPSNSLLFMAAHELWESHKILSTARSIVESDGAFQSLRCLTNYTHSNKKNLFLKNETLLGIATLARKFAFANKPEDMVYALVEFYRMYGAGKFALHCAFRWSAEKTLVPVSDLSQQMFSSIVGYDDQKTLLRANTELFLNGGEANNALLFGDSGTGKSTSIRALLNEPAYIAKGLRMIEIHKDQLGDIPEILRIIRNRNYRFVLFLDDLSFEEFEVEYKYLKALIEGGIERKPENTIIYATSNRRNLIREVWTDRRTNSDDVHGWDTMQEKLSLADRFGLTIWYGPATKEEYINIVKSIAKEYSIDMDDEELEKLAMRWEIDKGAFTGRAAKQFIQHLLIDMPRLGPDMR